MIVMVQVANAFFLYNSFKVSILSSIIFILVDVLKSVSRLMSKITSDEHKQLAGTVRNLLAVYQDAEDLINIGAYVHGSNPDIDKAIQYINQINEYLKQSTTEFTSYEQNLSKFLIVPANCLCSSDVILDISLLTLFNTSIAG